MAATKFIKQLRSEIDTIFNSFDLIEKSREVSLAYTALQLSKMWLGKVLVEIGQPNPYPSSCDPKSPVVEPTADAAKETLSARDNWKALFDEGREPFASNQATRIAKVKYFRGVIEDVVQEMNIPTFTPHLLENISEDRADAASFYAHQAVAKIMEAKMWMGMELSRLDGLEFLTKPSN